MPYQSIQLANRTRCAYTTSTSDFLCILVLILLFVGYVHSSYAASTQDTEKENLEQEVLTNEQDGTQWVKGRLLIIPRAGLSMKEMKKALGPLGIRPRSHLKELNVYICDVSEGVDETKLMRKLKKDRRFKSVELDMVVGPNLTLIDPSYGKSWALPKIQAPTAWDTTNGDGIIIAILDTGVNSNHPDLAANMVPGWNTFDDNEDSADVYGHGTKVAGAAAAAANNAAGSAGVSWGASIMPIRVSDLSGNSRISTIAKGIRWAADHGAHVVNISFGPIHQNLTIRSAAAYMRSKGGVVVISSGNSGQFVSDTPSDDLLVVSATSSSDVRPSWSNYGPFVDVSAPGVGIYTTLRSGGYGNVSGTSFASPITAATVALMMSANRDLTPVDLEQIIKSTAVDLGTSGVDNYYGAGRINAAAAVAAASARITVDDQAPLIAITVPIAGGVVSGVVPVDVNYSDNVGVVRVELYVNGQNVTTDHQSPFAFVWDTAGWTNGEYVLTTKAFDAAGNESTSSGVMVEVNNKPLDTEAPTVGIVSPTDGEVSGVAPINVNAEDNVGVVRVELFVNGERIMSDDQAPFAFSWDTTTVTDGTYTLTAKAFDEANNVGTSINASVTVNNVPSADTINPVITSFNLIDGMRIERRQEVNVLTTDNVGVTQITLIINGEQVAVSNSDTLNYSWYTRQRGSRESTHIVTTIATDQAGNSAKETVTVYN